MRVIVTRPAAQAAKWVADLRAAGLAALSLPLIEISDAIDPAALDAAWSHLSGYDAVMFVSANAVQGFFAKRGDRAPSWPTPTPGPTPTAKVPRAWVTGPGSLAALERLGVPPTLIDAPPSEAGQFDSEALWQQVAGQVRPGFRCLIVRGGLPEAADADSVPASSAEGVGRSWLADQLRAAGAEVDFVVTYVRKLPSLSMNAAALVQVAAGDGTVWLFSSSEAIENLCSLVPAQSWARARAVVTHPRIGQVAKAAGFGVVCESRPALGALVASIESLA